jgi:DNA modification methylase
MERFGAPSQSRLILGDCRGVAEALAAEGWRGKVDLIYVDPPFASQTSYTHETRLDGPADGRVRRVHAYNDSWAGSLEDDGLAAYLDMLAPSLEAMTTLLAPTGTIWVHLDWRAAYLVRVLLDEILGRKRFLNEIVWRRAPNLGRQATSGQFGRTLDTIVVYGGPKASLDPPTRLEVVERSAVRVDEEGRAFTTAPRGDYTDASMARLAETGRVYTSPSGRKYVKYFVERNDAGEFCRGRRVDTLWTDIAPLRHVAVSERTGYPTQKPRALLERIVKCATPANGVVADLFAGSGTTGEAAHTLGRTFLLGDVGAVALSTSRARLLRAGAAFATFCIADAAPTTNEASLDVRTRGGQVEAELLRPTEPLGWALGLEPVPGAPFVALWHAERRPGATPVPATRVASLSLADVPAGARLEARVYADDGGVARVVRSMADDHR